MPSTMQKIFWRTVALTLTIHYGFAEALTTYGIIGVKVWIFKGEIHEIKEETPEEEAAETAAEE